jgi:hypothetical protein
MLWVGGGGFPVEYGDGLISLGGRHFCLWSLRAGMQRRRCLNAMARCSKPLGGIPNTTTPPKPPLRPTCRDFKAWNR